MNKKFLSAILFGALMATSTSTFVSCKDYDDDINGLQEQIDAQKSDLSSQISTLQTALSNAQAEASAAASTAKTAADNAAKEAAAAKQAAAEAKEAAIADAKSKVEALKTELEGKLVSKETYDAKVTEIGSEIAGIDTELNTLTSKVDENTAAVAQLKTQVAALENFKTLVETYKLDDKFTAIDNAIKKLNDGIETLATAADVEQKMNDMAAEVAKVNTNLLTIFGQELRGLVLNPQLYYGGIEAVQVSAIEYKALTLDEVCADDDHATDAAVEATATTQMTPLLTATYHMNPSTADLSGLTKENFKFLFEDKVYKSRALGLTCEILGFDTETSKGDVSVSAKFTNGAFAEGDKVTTLALEVELEEGKTITSDYAAVYAEKITGFVLDNEKTNPTNPASVTCDKLPTTAAEAIKKDAVVKVAWDQTVDLADYVETHYTVKNASTGKDDCKLLTETTLAGYGFSYKYELVGYTVGANETSQSAHAALEVGGSKLRPQLPKDGKAAAWGATKQSQATVGRKPLVRVTLVDNNSNKNVAVAYVKVEITATPGENTIGANAAYTFTDKFTLSCAQSLEPMTVKWYQIEETILAQLGISKSQFDDKEHGYKYDEGKFFDKAALDAKELTGTAVPNVTVTPTTVDVEGTMTEVLEMTVNANYAYEHFLNGENTTMPVIVRYYKKTGEDALGIDTYDYVYVTLNWAPSPLNAKPEGTIADADKIKQYWFAKNNNEGGSGYNEIHVNVNVPGNGNVSTTNFLKNILNTFVDDDITISGVNAVYTDFEDVDLTKELVFAETQSTTPLIGTDGKSYAIKVDETDNKVLNAHEIVSGEPSVNGTPIVKLNGSKIIYQDEDVAKALLNAAGRDELAKNVTATILVKETNTCGKSLVKLNNNTFDVKFLRPITVTQATMDSFKDGVDVGTEGSKVNLKLNFTDWRNYAFTDEYFNHYGVTNINADTENATTNVSGTWAALPTGMSLDYTPATTISLTDYGYLTYKNNNTEVGNFSIKVPVTVTYVWGTIELVVEIQVAKTV